MTDPGAERSRSPRSYAVALVLLACGAGLMLLAYGRTWVSATVGGSGLPTLHVDLTGRDLQPEGTAAALVALAGVAALVATRRGGRLVTGVVLLAVGAGAALRALQVAGSGASSSPDGDVGRLVAERTGVGVSGLAVVHSVWWAAAAVGGALVAVGGVVVLARSRSWPALGRRYERRDDRVGGVPVAVDRRPESAWEQLDRGVDPTADTASDPTLGDGPDA